MIDFNNAAFIKLKPTNDDAFVNNISPIFVKGESILGTYKGIRDGVVFTTHRIIAINVQVLIRGTFLEGLTLAIRN